MSKTVPQRGKFCWVSPSPDLTNNVTMHFYCAFSSSNRALISPINTVLIPLPCIVIQSFFSYWSIKRSLQLFLYLSFLYYFLISFLLSQHLLRYLDFFYFFSSFLVDSLRALLSNGLDQLFSTCSAVHNFVLTCFMHCACYIVISLSWSKTTITSSLCKRNLVFFICNFSSRKRILNCRGLNWL